MAGFNMIMLINIIVLLSCLFAVNSWAIDSSSYARVGGEIEAYGKVVGTYNISLAFTELCGKDPVYKKEAEETARNYISTNQAILNDLMKVLDGLAIKNGGEEERLDLNEAMNKMKVVMKPQFISEARKQIVNTQSCASILENLRIGVMDLNTQRRDEISLIMRDSNDLGKNKMNPSASFLQGTLEGCIDGQKRIFRQQGVPYEGNEELILQYCYCMSPLTAEILSTSDKRARMLNGDPWVMEQLKNVADICLDGVNSGRHFGP
jgi:hypothetical protein